MQQVLFMFNFHSHGLSVRHLYTVRATFNAQYIQHTIMNTYHSWCLSQARPDTLYIYLYTFYTVGRAGSRVDMSVHSQFTRLVTLSNRSRYESSTGHSFFS